MCVYAYLRLENTNLSKKQKTGPEPWTLGSGHWALDPGSGTRDPGPMTRDPRDRGPGTRCLGPKALKVKAAGAADREPAGSLLKDPLRKCRELRSAATLGRFMEQGTSAEQV